MTGPDDPHRASGGAVRTQPPADPASQAALERYATSLRGPRLAYFAVVAAVVTGLGVLVGVAWSRGEVAHTTLHTVAHPPRTPALSAASLRPRRVWTSTDAAAIGNPQYGGTVVVHDTHTVRGRDVATGATTWSYRRSDRTVCAAVQTAGVTIAVYARDGNCDEVTALDSGTGERDWSRTLDISGLPVNGRPTYQLRLDTVLITTPTVVYAIDPSNGWNRWTYSRFGCRITGAALGTTGALISQDCTTPRCGTQRFCGHGPQLLMRDALKERADDDKSRNPDRILWNHLGDTDIPVSADSLVAALNTTTGKLDTLDASSGAARASVRLSPAPAPALPGAPPRVVAVDGSGVEVVWIDGVTYVIRPGATDAEWSARTLGPVSIVTSVAGPALFATSRITAAGPGGAQQLAGADGHVTRSFPLSVTPRAGSSVAPLGTGFLVTSDAGVAVYR